MPKIVIVSRARVRTTRSQNFVLGRRERNMGLATSPVTRRASRHQTSLRGLINITGEKLGRLNLLKIEPYVCRRAVQSNPPIPARVMIKWTSPLRYVAPHRLFQATGVNIHGCFDAFGAQSFASRSYLLLRFFEVPFPGVIFHQLLCLQRGPDTIFFFMEPNPIHR